MRKRRNAAWLSRGEEHKRRGKKQEDLKYNKNICETQSQSNTLSYDLIALTAQIVG